MKRVIVACGGAVATSTIAANKVRDLCKEYDIPLDLCQCRIAEIGGNLPADLIVTTSKCTEDFGVPIVKGTPFISGLGVEDTEDEILGYLLDDEE